MSRPPLDLDATAGRIRAALASAMCGEWGQQAAYAALDALLDRVQELEAKVERLTSRGIEDLRAHNAELTAALEQIANPKAGPFGLLGLKHGGSGAPEEVARAALAGEKPA